MLIQAVIRRVVASHNSVVNSEAIWQTQMAVELYGKTIGIVGLGKLGKATAKVSHLIQKFETIPILYV